MSKKFNNKLLLGIFVGLIAVFAIVKWYQKTQTESTLNTNIVDFDSTKISKIILLPSSYKQTEIVFSKEKNDWKIQSGKVITEPDHQAIKSLISMLMEVKPQRLASKDKKKWAEYQVTDTSATKVKVYEGSKLVLDLLIGKFTYQQSKDPYDQMGGRGGISGTSYVRLNNEDEVYAVDGFLTFSFNQPFNTFRNQTVTNLDKASITKFSVKYPGDSSFVAEKKEGKWVVDNTLPDSVKMETYLNTVSNKSLQSFNDMFKPIGLPTCQLIIETSDKKKLTVDAYANGDKQWIINSSINPKSWFASSNAEVFGQLFVTNEFFKADKQKKK